MRSMKLVTKVPSGILNMSNNTQTKDNQIVDRICLKLYGDKKMSKQLVNLLGDHGYKVYGSVDSGNKYTNKKGQHGFASTVTIKVDYDCD